MSKAKKEFLFHNALVLIALFIMFQTHIIQIVNK